MNATRAATLVGTIGGGIASFIGLVLVLAAGIGLLMLPWTITLLLSGLNARRAPDRAARQARFALLLAVFNAAGFVAMVAISFSTGLLGLFIFWLIVAVPLPLIQWMLTRHLVTAAPVAA